METKTKKLPKPRNGFFQSIKVLDTNDGNWTAELMVHNNLLVTFLKQCVQTFPNHKYFMKKKQRKSLIMVEFGELFLWIFPRISNGFEKLYQTFFFMFDIYITWKSFLWYLFNAELLQAWLAYGLWVTIIIVNGHDVEGFECDIHWHLPNSMCTHVGRVRTFVNKIVDSNQ